MTVVSLVPAHERPYVDGTQNDSVYSQVFDYNGIARIEHGAFTGAGPPAAFIRTLAQEGRALNGQTIRIRPGWHRLLSGLFGRDDGWLLPAALIAAVGVLLERRRAGRRDPLRASILLWGTWLVVLGVVFSEGVYLNSYYVAALSPATAALCGVGAAVFWRRRRSPWARVALAGALLTCAGYGAYLLQGTTAAPGWLLPAALCLGVAGALVALLLRRLRSTPGAARPAAVLVVACALMLPAVTSVLVVTRDLSPFSAPYQPQSRAASHFSAELAAYYTRAVVDHFSSTYHTPIALATDTSTLADTYIYYTGKEILPIGGYLGGVPSPSLSQLQRYIASRQVRAFLIPVEPPSKDPRIVWVHTHCAPTKQPKQRNRVQFGIYDCPPKVGLEAIRRTSTA